MRRTKVILKIISFFILLLGLIYIGLSELYMGFDRDLVYREYVLEKEFLQHINFTFISLFWGALSIFTCRELFYTNSLYKSFNVYVFMLLLGVTSLYQFDTFIRTMLFVVLNIFGFFRVIIFVLERRGA